MLVNRQALHDSSADYWRVAAAPRSAALIDQISDSACVLAVEQAEAKGQLRGCCLFSPGIFCICHAFLPKECNVPSHE